MGQHPFTLDFLRTGFAVLLLAIASTASGLPRDSIVHVTAQRWSVDYSMAWRIDSIQPSTGSGI
ncbi:hypothetical protein LL252_00745 [Alcanivorax marinus]|mgnify:CR=1 FL=1|uniref:Uncharacterized protein n=1 Tax=Alloalcanivorax marinus TaxID=1177169 RepID=A0A9Q3YPY8_9GAMM|nr:hypothetical protein [Alloalcanivorax marinus]MCC4307083.1 hypothetical protein [Alloalcanivorax marinus]